VAKAESGQQPKEKEKGKTGEFGDPDALFGGTSKPSSSGKSSRSEKGSEKPEKAEKAEKAPSEKPAAGDAGGNEPGFLVANTQPWAKVLIDGKDTGKTTPIAPRSKIPLKPGKHVVTFVANGKKYNFDIVVKSGEDFRLIRQLSE
jgi:hypothetical protein